MWPSIVSVLRIFSVSTRSVYYVNRNTQRGRILPFGYKEKFGHCFHISSVNLKYVLPEEFLRI